jgi:hypothetical protein
MRSYTTSDASLPRSAGEPSSELYRHNALCRHPPELTTAPASASLASPRRLLLGVVRLGMVAADPAVEAPERRPTRRSAPARANRAGSLGRREAEGHGSTDHEESPLELKNAVCHWIAAQDEDRHVDDGAYVGTAGASACCLEQPRAQTLRSGVGSWVFSWSRPAVPTRWRNYWRGPSGAPGQTQPAVRRCRGWPIGRPRLLQEPRIRLLRRAALIGTFRHCPVSTGYPGADAVPRPGPMLRAARRPNHLRTAERRSAC